MNDLQQCELSILKEVDALCRKHGIRYCLSSGTMLGAVRHKGFIPWDDDLDLVMNAKDYFRFLEIARKELPGELFVQTSDTDVWYRAYAKIRRNGTTMIEKSYQGIRFHQGVWIDIFPLMAVPDDPKKVARINRLILLSELLVQDEFFAITENLSSKLKLLTLLPLGLRRKLANLLRRKACRPIETCETCDYYWGFPFKAPRFRSAWFAEMIPADFEDIQAPIPREYDAILTRVYGDYMTPPPEGKRNGGHTIAVLDLNNSYEKYFSPRKKNE